MRIIEDDTRIDEYGQPVNYVFTGDWHVGASNCAYKELRDTINILKKTNDKIILNGDLIDCITYKDKRFNPEEIAEHYKISQLKDLPVHQINEVIELLEPIKDRIVAMIYGNHEGKFMQYNCFDPLSYLKGKLGISAEILGKKGYVIARVRKSDESATWLLACMHGKGGSGRTVGYKYNVVDNEFNRIIADCKIMGHIHQQSADFVDYETVNTNGNNKALRMMRMHYGAHGCYMYKSNENTEGYFEDAAGQHSSIGYLTYEIMYNSRKCDSQTNLLRKDYQQYL